MSEKIETLHPDPRKQGVNIDRGKYMQISQAISGILQDGETLFQDLVDQVGQQLAGEFDGSVPWYVTTIKLDMEARGLIERVPDSSPQRLRLTTKGG